MSRRAVLVPYSACHSPGIIFGAFFFSCFSVIICLLPDFQEAEEPIAWAKGMRPAVRQRLDLTRWHRDGARDKQRGYSVTLSAAHLCSECRFLAKQAVRIVFRNSKHRDATNTIFRPNKPRCFACLAGPDSDRKRPSAMVAHPREAVPTIEKVNNFIRMFLVGKLDFRPRHQNRFASVRAEKPINTGIFAEYSVFTGKADMHHI